jgi:hypothetical protein
LLGVTDAEHPKLLIRRGVLPEAPNNLIIIGRTTVGDVICFEDGSDRIIEWSHESGEVFLEWEDFYSFLKDAEEIYGGGDE